MEKMCTCTSKHHGLLKWKCVLFFCDKRPSIFLPSQEANKDTTNTCPTIRFHFYRNVTHCTVHVQCHFQSIQTKRTCVTRNTKKRISWKVIHSRDTKLAFHLQHVRILGNRHCSKELRDTFKCRGNSHDVL